MNTSTMKQRPRSCARREKEAGVALVEFALVLPVLLLLVLGILDFGRAFNYWIDETHLANQASRFTVVDFNPGASSNPAQTLQTFVKNQANTTELRDGNGGTSAGVVAPLEVCVDFYGKTAATVVVGDPVRVTVKSVFRFLPFIGSFADTSIKATSTMRLEAKPTSYLLSDNIGLCT